MYFSRLLSSKSRNIASTISAPVIPPVQRVSNIVRRLSLSEITSERYICQKYRQNNVSARNIARTISRSEITSTLYNVLLFFETALIYYIKGHCIVK